MIWVDSSFAVEWLMGTPAAKRVAFPKEPLVILPMQYVEVLVYFLRQNLDPAVVIGELEALELRNPEKVHLQEASSIYLAAREKKSKASLADAILAAVAHIEEEKVLSFDHDFASLKMQRRGSFWYPSDL